MTSKWQAFVKQTIHNELEGRAEKRQMVFVPKFLVDMENIHGIHPCETFAVLRREGYVHPDITYDKFLERNSVDGK